MGWAGWQFLSREGLREVGAEIARWAWPYILSGVLFALTMLSAIISPVPLPYLLAASAVAFGGIAWGLLYLSVLRERNRVRDRLYFENVYFARDYEERDGALYLTAVQFGFYMRNSAPFPIYFRVDEIRSSFAKRIEPNPTFETRGGIVIKDA